MEDSRDKRITAQLAGYTWKLPGYASKVPFSNEDSLTTVSYTHLIDIILCHAKQLVQFLDAGLLLHGRRFHCADAVLHGMQRGIQIIGGKKLLLLQKAERIRIPL